MFFILKSQRLQAYLLVFGEFRPVIDIIKGNVQGFFLSNFLGLWVVILALSFHPYSIKSKSLEDIKSGRYRFR